MIRQHQFYKVELVSIVESDKCLNELEEPVSLSLPEMPDLDDLLESDETVPSLPNLDDLF